MMLRASHGKGLLFFGLYITEKMRDHSNPDPVFSVTRRIKAKQAVCRLFSGKPRQKR